MSQAHEGPGYQPPARQSGITSSVSAVEYPWLSEGNDNAQHTTGSYEPDWDNIWAADASETSSLGAPFFCSVVPGVGKNYIDGYISKVLLKPITIAGEDDLEFAGGIFVDSQGNPLTDGMTKVDDDGIIYTVSVNEGEYVITVDSSDSSWKPVDFNGFGGVYYVPEDSDSDLDIKLHYEVYLDSVVGNRTLRADFKNSIYLAFDAVADLPEYQGGAETEVIFEHTDNENPNLSPVLEYENGIASHTIGGAALGTEKQAVMTLGNIAFSDFADGSEEHFILVSCLDDNLQWSFATSLFGTTGYEALLPPGNGEFDIIWLNDDKTEAEPGDTGAVMYYKILVDNEYLIENDGEVGLSLPLIVGEESQSGSYLFDVKLGARETVTPDDVYDIDNDEIDFGNNFAVTDIENGVEVAVLLLKSEIKISTGWAYESGAAANGTANPNAAPDEWGYGDGATGSFSHLTVDGSTLSSAAFIKIAMPDPVDGETLGEWLSLEYDASRGDVHYPNGALISTSSGNGVAVVNISRSQYETLFGATDEFTFYFVPKVGSDDDSDFFMKYGFDVIGKGAGGTSHTYHISNELPIVIDAVADAAVTSLAPSGVAPAFDGFTMDYVVEIHHDNSEQQYIVIANPDGLLELGDLGVAAPYLTQVDATELQAYDNPDPDAVHYFDNLDDTYIILRVDDPEALDQLDNVSDGKLNLSLPFTVTDRESAGEELEVTISTVIVEGGGNDPDNWSPEQHAGRTDTTPGETDFANNIAVTESTTVVRLSEGIFTVVEAAEVYEGDKAEQHLYGDDDVPEYGAVVDLDLADSHEAIHEISFTLQSADGAADPGGSLMFGYGSGSPTAIPAGGGLRFTSELGGEENDTAHYTKAQIVDDDGAIIAVYTINPAVTLSDMVNAEGPMGLRFVPSGDGDSDVVVDFTARVVDLDSGDTITVEKSLTIIRDAVADLPVDASSEADATNAGYGSVVLDATVTVNVQASFGDYTDGSEAHYLFVGKEYLESITIPSNLASSFAILSDAAAADVFAQVDGVNGIPDADGDDYFVIRVAPSYLQANNGNVELPMEAQLKPDLSADGEATLNIKAVAVEYEGFLTATDVDRDDDPDYSNVETSAVNNVAVADASSAISWATLENDFTLTVENPAFEGDLPNQYAPGGTGAAGGAGLTLTSGDPGEIFTEMTLTCLGADGQPAQGQLALFADGDRLNIPNGAVLELEYDTTAPALCVKVGYTDGDGVEHYLEIPGLTLEQLTSQGLRYIPSGDSDTDVVLSLSGTTLETASGETGEKELEVTIIVDAVADLPTDASSEALPQNSGYASVVADDTFTINVQTTFGDYADGSESHYLFVAKTYLNAVGIPTALTDYFEVLSDADAGDICAQVDGAGGLPDADAGGFFVVRVDSGYLAANGGDVELPLEAQLKTTLSDDGAGTIIVKAVAVEHDGYLTQTETDIDTRPGVSNEEFAAGEDVPGNNISVTDASSEFTWARLENSFAVTVESPAYENDRPAANVGDATPNGGAVLKIAPEDSSEVFDTLQIDYAGEDSQAAQGHVVLFAGSDQLEIPSGTVLSFTYASPQSALCVSVGYIDDEGTPHSLDVPDPGLTLQQLTTQGLRYIPYAGGNDSDIDVKVTFSGTTRETASGETGTYAETTVQVIVDAVADKPDGDKTDYDYTPHGTDGNGDALYNSLNDGSPVSFPIEATFSDYADGSEAHYLFINTRYLESGSLELVDPATGLTFTGGLFVTDPDDIAELFSRIDPTGLPAGAPGLIPQTGDEYVVLQIDPTYLQANGGTVALVVEGALKDAADLKDLGTEKALLDIDVKAVAVEHEGYETLETSTPSASGDEFTASNNVAVTDVGVRFRWDSLKNEFALTPETAYEGDRPNQHLSSDSYAGGAALVVSPADSSEVFTRMELEYDNTHGDIVMRADNANGTSASIILPPDVDIFFTFDADNPTLIVKVEWEKDTWNAGTLNVYDADGNMGMTLEDLTQSGMRYVPHIGDNDDADLTVVIHADTLETNTGTTGETTLTNTVVVDAAADRPDAESELQIVNGKDNTVVINETDGIVGFEVNIEANFNDYEDGSEAHYLFVCNDFLADIQGWPEGITLLDGTTAEAVLDDAGLDDKYYVLEVSPDYLQDNDGAVEFTLAASLDPDSLPGEDTPFLVDIKAGAIEHQGYNTPVDGTGLGDEHGLDSRADNNVSLVDIGVTLEYAVLDNIFDITVGNAWEGDRPDQHLPDLDQAGGAPITIVPNDSSEVFDTLAFNYDDSEGTVRFDLPTTSGNVTVTVPDGAELAFAYKNDGAGATQCISITITAGSVSAVYTLSAPMTLPELTGSTRLRYLPDSDSQSDNDVTVTFSGTARETASGESGEFSTEVVVKVDAVADHPDASAGAANPLGREALAAGKPFNLTVNTTFGADIADGSEAHYLFVGRDYLASIIIPGALTGDVEVLSDADAAEVCSRINGTGGIPGASAGAYFVIQVSDAYLQANAGEANLNLQGVLKTPAALQALGVAEGEELTFDIKAVAVEHEGFLTDTADDLGNGHGYDVRTDNNVSVDDASSSFTFAVLDNQIITGADAAYEGDQKEQVTGDWTTLEGGAAVTIFPDDDSEIFKELTLTYDATHGSLKIVMPDESIAVVPSGARLVFFYDPAHPSECVEVQVYRPGETSPSSTLSFLDATTGRGVALQDLTGDHLRYVPAPDDNNDADVEVSFSGTIMETESGEEGPTSGSVMVVVDAVADMPVDTESAAVIVDDNGVDRTSVKPGDEFEINIKAEFRDYGGEDSTDSSEAHYLFISKEHLAQIGDFPTGVSLLTDPDALEALFSAVEKDGEAGIGIHAGPAAAADYYVLEVDSSFLQAADGSLDLTMTAATPSGDDESGTHLIEIKAVSVEHDGFLTDVTGVGGGTDRELTAENNVAVGDASFELDVRLFLPEKVKVEPEEPWVFENDRSDGYLEYHAPGNTDDRDDGVRLLFTEGPGEGNVVSSITFSYPAPEHGSSLHDLITSSTPDLVTITYDTSGAPGYVVACVVSNDPYESVGELRFVPGDNYENNDVDITVVNVVVADPALGVNTSTDPVFSDPAGGWDNGIVEGTENLHVKIDAVAQKPDIDLSGVDFDSDNPVLAGSAITIKGKVSFEDLQDGSEEHFVLLEIRDGYYPDAVTLTYGDPAVSVTHALTHYQSSVPPVLANYTLQELITPDDEQPHLFCKLKVDDTLAELMGSETLYRMDNIDLAVAYQTREWAEEGASLHFGAISTEDVEMVREYDANFSIINDEQPFDKILEDYGILVDHPNNTAIAVDADAVYVYWDSSDPDDVKFDREYVFENDRPADYLREPVELPGPNVIPPYLEPNDSDTLRDLGTAKLMNIPANSVQVEIDYAEGYPEGHGAFYFLPESVWDAFADSHPTNDADIAAYEVIIGGGPKAQPGTDNILVFIPENESYDDPAHTETGGSHMDTDLHFDYKIIADQYGPNGEARGSKRYMGTDEIIRVDAVANQAEIIQAGDLTNTDKFSLWGGSGTTSSFPLTVSFHDLDATEDHYILAEVVVNFGFECNGYTYTKGNSDDIYTHVTTNADGVQTMTRYYKIPVSLDQIDPVTGEVTVDVNYIRLPGQPANAKYPSSEDLRYGALTEDETGSRWDSLDPTAENFINRIGADGEYTWDNNTSVIIRSGVDNGVPGSGSVVGPNGPWNDGNSGGELPGGNGTGGIYTPGGPGGGWGGGWRPDGVSGGGGGYWNPGGPAGGGGWWTSGGGGGGGGGSTEWGLPGSGGAWDVIGPGGGGGGGSWSYSPDGSDNPWIASRGQGFAIEWVFENSTPEGNTYLGQYNSVVPTACYVQCLYPDGTLNTNGAYVLITVPGITAQLIEGTNPDDYHISPDQTHHRGEFATFDLSGTYSGVEAGIPDLDGNKTFKVLAPGGQLPDDVRLFFMAAPDSLETDFDLQVQWFDADDNQMSDGTVRVMVDAVAQWANFEFDIEDGIIGVTGDEPRTLHDVKVNVNFLDQDGSEGNYVLVYKMPGVLVLHVTGHDQDNNNIYGTVKEVYLNGKTYYALEPTAEELASGQVSLQLSVNADLTSPLYVRDDIVYKGQTFTGMRIEAGTMTIEGSIGEQDNWECLLDNNTSLNLKEDALTIVVSKANAKGGNNFVMVKETDDPEADIVRLDPDDPATRLNLNMDENDTVTSLVFTSVTGNGVLLYEDENGDFVEVVPGMETVELYMAGKLYHKQDRYEDSDAKLTWTATVADALTTSTVQVSGTATIAVDAVAKSEEIHLSFPIQDKDAGTLTLNLTFDDHQANEMHYAVVAPDLFRVLGKTALVFDADGIEQTVDVETIFDPRGKPYYAVRVDGCLDENGAVRVQFDLHDLNIPGIANAPVVSGGVSVEPNSGYYADDREIDLQDNWAINVEPDLPARGFVQTESLAFAVAGIAEDSATGAAVTLLSDSIGENDIITAASLSFAVKPGTVSSDISTGFDGAEGEQVATLVYDGESYAVTLDGAGNAVAALDFGTEGFDASADFRIIWGTAHMENGAVVVDSYNHAATGTLDLNTAFTVTNTLTGLTATLAGVDPNGIDLAGNPDGGEDIAGVVTGIAGEDADPGDLIGAGADSVTVTVTGTFADYDGSETHYLFLEVPVGWDVLSPGNGVIETVGSTRYYRVAVDGTEAQPTALITLLPPDGVNSDVALKTASRVVEDGNPPVFTQGGTVVLHLSDVSATGLDVQVDAVPEDGLFSLAALGDAGLTGTDGNDTLLSVTFTNLQGGTIVDADGDTVSRTPLTFTGEELASGDYFYKPAEDYAGEPDAFGIAQPIPLTYNAVLGETNTGAIKNLVNQQLSVEVTPVADAPVDVDGDTDIDDLGEALNGHKAVLPLSLEAAFADTDGSEQHFFVLHVPDGVAVKSGDGYTVAALSAGELSALNGQFPSGGALYKVLADNTVSQVTLDVNLEITSTAYNGGDALFVGGAAEALADGTYSYAFSEQASVALPDALEDAVFNVDPEAVPDAASMDTWRDADKITGGAVSLNVDPDGDTVSVSGLGFGEEDGTRDTFGGSDCWTVDGDYGTLHLFDDGTYTYHLNAGEDGTAATEVFGYELTDAYGGSSQSVITITLTGDNDAPFADADTATLDSVRSSVTRGNLVYGDDDGDAVSVVAVSGVTTLTNFGTELNPVWGYEAQGDYGTLQVYQDTNGNWQYIYTLDPAHKGTTEDEAFTYTVRDAYGLEATNTIDIDLFNVNTAPVAEDGTLSMDTLRDADGEAAGSVALSDAEGDVVELNAVTGPNGPGAWGEDDAGDAAFVVEGDHGVLYLYPAGDSVQYRYVYTDTTAAGVNSAEVFTYSVDDGYLGTDTATLTINLTNANTAPVVTGDFSLDLDTYRTPGGEIEGGISFSDTDYNSDQERYDTVALSGVGFGTTQGTSDGAGGFTVNGDYGSFHIEADGTYAYTLDPDAVGVVATETFSVTVTDEFGKPTTKTIAVNLQSDNDAPTVEEVEVDFDSWRITDIEGAADISDPDAGDTPRVTWLSDGVEETMPDGRTALTADGTYGTIHIFEDGSYTYEFTGTAGVEDTDVFEFAVTDGHGGSTTSSITINLTADNEDPEAESETESLDTHTASSVTGMVSFYDGDYYMDGTDTVYDEVFLQALTGPDAEAEAEEVAENGKTGFAVDGEHGCLYLFADGSFRYELTDTTPGLTGTEIFTYQVADLYGGSGSGNITINLANINTDPAAASGASSLDTWREGAIVAGSVTLADADGDTVTVNGVSHATGGSGTWGVDDEDVPAFVASGQYGTLYLYTDGDYRYVLTDPAGTGGSEVFTYTVQDGYGGSAQNSITITLTNANTAPVIGGDLSAVIEGSVQDYANGDIYASGQISWQDAENDGISSLTVGGVALPSSGSITVEGEYGTLIVSADGSYTYTLSPGMDEAGIDDEESFAIVATDIYGAESQENLLVTLTPLTHAPECSDLNVNWLYTPSGDPTTVVTGNLVFSDVDSGYEDSTETLLLQVNGYTVPEDESCVIAGDYGMLTINNAGLFSYTPSNGNLNQPYLDHFTYTVTDQTGNIAEADLYIRLSNNAPVFPNTGDTEAGVYDHTDTYASLSSFGALFSGDGEGQTTFESLFSSGFSTGNSETSLSGTGSDDGIQSGTGETTSNNAGDQASTYGSSGTSYEDDALQAALRLLSQGG